MYRKLERITRETIVAPSMYYSSIHLEGLTKITKILSQDNLYPCI
jgi:hypothetical protein